MRNRKVNLQIFFFFFSVKPSHGLVFDDPKIHCLY